MPAEQVLHDDNGDPIGTRRFCVDHGLTASAADGLVQALTTLTPAEINVVLQNRVVIERARGMLMFIYDIDEQEALELLTWRSQQAGVLLPRLSRQLVDDLVASSHDRLTLRSRCDEILHTVHHRLGCGPNARKNRPCLPKQEGGRGGGGGI